MNITPRLEMVSQIETGMSYFSLLSLCTSPLMEDVTRKVKQVSKTGSVIVFGETGCGKEIIARSVHELSPRKDQPLVAVNCGSLNSGIIGSELFGHEKGAFTGAMKQRKGFFEQAAGGTIFLDEIGELPMELQSLLLRVLDDEGEFFRVGGETMISPDFRLICGTNCDLKEAVRTRKFREDLYHRLNVFPIHVPPLRKRCEDIVPIANYLLTKMSTKTGSVKKLAKETEASLLSYPWPGNVRELKTVLGRALILCEDREIIRKDDLYFESTVDEAEFTVKLNTQGFTPRLLADCLHQAAMQSGSTVVNMYEEALEELVKDLIPKKAKQDIAAILGMDQATCYRRFWGRKPVTKN